MCWREKFLKPWKNLEAGFLQKVIVRFNKLATELSRRKLNLIQ